MANMHTEINGKPSKFDVHNHTRTLPIVVGVQFRLISLHFKWSKTSILRLLICLALHTYAALSLHTE